MSGSNATPRLRKLEADWAYSHPADRQTVLDEYGCNDLDELLMQQPPRRVSADLFRLAYARAESLPQRSFYELEPSDQEQVIALSRETSTRHVRHPFFPHD